MVLSVYIHKNVPGVVYSYLHADDESVYDVAGELYYRVIRDTMDRYNLTLMGVDASRERWINDIIDARFDYHNVDTVEEGLTHLRRWYGSTLRFVL